jgi:hypothetical protein
MENPAGAVRYALRQFWLSRVFTAAAVLTLALGIGGTTAIFTLIHAVMLRSLPVADPARLYVSATATTAASRADRSALGHVLVPVYERLKADASEFEELAAFQAGGPRLSVRREGVDAAARPLRSEYVTGNYFTTLGVARSAAECSRRTTTRRPRRRWSCSAITSGRARTAATRR